MFRISCDRTVTQAQLGTTQGDIVLACANGVTSAQVIKAMQKFMGYFASLGSVEIQHVAGPGVVLDDAGESGTITF